MTRSDMPRRVYLRHGRYFFVTLAGKWLPLTRERDGLPAMYRALAALTDAAAASDLMPAVLARWLDAKRPEWTADKTVENMERVVLELGEAFREFTPADVTTPACAAHLRQYPARTSNVHRSVLRQVLAFAAVEGLREGFNPVDNIPQRKTVGRKRVVTDAEIQQLRAAAVRHEGKDGAADKAVRNGAALVQMIDLALLTGMRIGDLIRVRWQDVSADGIRWTEGKGKAPRLCEWSPALRAAIAACERGDRIGHVLQKEAGGGYRYSGIRSAWVRACERAGIVDLNIHDFRGRAGVDAMGDDEDIRKAQRLLGHAGEAMTRHYVEGKYAKRTKPAK